MKYSLEHFDTLKCPICCAPTEPEKVKPGPIVFYKCKCKTSWRIDADGDITHLKESNAFDEYGDIGNAHSP